ncbi:hypothetical protein PIB30_090335, partial [Stylosanthes scabra]|nr:hypothetical protein [Stylosanthes scabra]
MSWAVKAQVLVTSQTSSTPAEVSCSHVVSAGSSTSAGCVYWSVGCDGSAGWASEYRTGESSNDSNWSKSLSSSYSSS